MPPPWPEKAPPEDLPGTRHRVPPGKPPPEIPPPEDPPGKPPPEIPPPEDPPGKPPPAPAPGPNAAPGSAPPADPPCRKKPRPPPAPGPKPPPVDALCGPPVGKVLLVAWPSVCAAQVAGAASSAASATATTTSRTRLASDSASRTRGDRNHDHQRARPRELTADLPQDHEFGDGPAGDQQRSDDPRRTARAGNPERRRQHLADTRADQRGCPRRDHRHVVGVEDPQRS